LEEAEAAEKELADARARGEEEAEIQRL